MRKKVWITAGDIVLVGKRDFQDEKVDIVHKYTADEARNLKQYGELPETARINETAVDMAMAGVFFYFFLCFAVRGDVSLFWNHFYSKIRVSNFCNYQATTMMLTLVLTLMIFKTGISVLESDGWSSRLKWNKDTTYFIKLKSNKNVYQGIL